MKSESKLQEKAQQSFGQLEASGFTLHLGLHVQETFLSSTDLSGLGESVTRGFKRNQTKLLLKTLPGSDSLAIISKSQVSSGTAIYSYICVVFSANYFGSWFMC